MHIPICDQRGTEPVQQGSHQHWCSQVCAIKHQQCVQTVVWAHTMTVTLLLDRVDSLQWFPNLSTGGSLDLLGHWARLPIRATTELGSEVFLLLLCLLLGFHPLDGFCVSPGRHSSVWEPLLYSMSCPNCALFAQKDISTCIWGNRAAFLGGWTGARAVSPRSWKYPCWTSLLSLDSGGGKEILAFPLALCCSHKAVQLLSGSGNPNHSPMGS